MNVNEDRRFEVFCENAKKITGGGGGGVGVGSGLGGTNG